MKYAQMLKECKKLAKSQSLDFKRSKTIALLNNRACYEIESGFQYKVLFRGNLTNVYMVLISEKYKGQ